MLRRLGIGVLSVVFVAGCMDTGDENQKSLAEFNAELQSASATASAALVNGPGSGVGACCDDAGTRGATVGSCRETNQDDCLQSGGMFTLGATCESDSCEIGSCCTDDICNGSRGDICCDQRGFCCDELRGDDCDCDDICDLRGTGGIPSCLETTRVFCDYIAGDFGGDGSICMPGSCDDDPLGACCFEGECQGENCDENRGIAGCFDLVPESECRGKGGEFFENTPCSQAPCGRPVVGACCLTREGEGGGEGGGEGEGENGDRGRPSGCEEVPEDVCRRLGGDYAGDGSFCQNVDCDDEQEGGTEACCMDNGNCFDLDPDVCDREGGVASGPGTSCSTFSCGEGNENGNENENNNENGNENNNGGDDSEACCMDNGNCFDLEADVCLREGGEPAGFGTSCSTFSCGEGNENENGNENGNENNNENGNENQNENNNMNGNGNENGNANANENGNENTNENENSSEGEGRPGIRR